MKAKSGYQTDGNYIKYKSGFTQSWCVELADKTHFFKTEDEADFFIFKLPKPHDELLQIISDTYKLINFSDQVEEPYRENIRQARKKLNILTGIIRKNTNVVG